MFQILCKNKVYKDLTKVYKDFFPMSYDDDAVLQYKNTRFPLKLNFLSALVKKRYINLKTATKILYIYNTDCEYIGVVVWTRTRM